MGEVRWFARLALILTGAFPALEVFMTAFLRIDADAVTSAIPAFGCGRLRTCRWVSPGVVIVGSLHNLVLPLAVISAESTPISVFVVIHVKEEALAVGFSIG